MEYIRELFLTPSVTQSIVLLTLTVCLGLWAGEHLRIKNFSLGVTWILFVGIILSSFGISIDPQVSHFAKNFGLILFGFCRAVGAAVTVPEGAVPGNGAVRTGTDVLGGDRVFHRKSGYSV